MIPEPPASQDVGGSLCMARRQPTRPPESVPIVPRHESRYPACRAARKSLPSKWEKTDGPVAARG